MSLAARDCRPLASTPNGCTSASWAGSGGSPRVPRAAPKLQGAGRGPWASSPPVELLDASPSWTVWTVCLPVGKEVIRLTDVEAEAYLTGFPCHLTWRHSLDPIPQMLGQPFATVKLNGFISPQWPQFSPPPLDLGRIGALGPVRGTGRPVQTTVLESGPEWVSGSPPSLPCEEGLAGGRQAYRLCPCLYGPSSEVFGTDLSCACQRG